MKVILISGICIFGLTACGGSDDATHFDRIHTEACGNHFHPHIPSGQFFAIDRVANERRAWGDGILRSNFSAIWLSTLPGRSVENTDIGLLTLTPFGANHPKLEEIKVSIDTPLPNGATACLTGRFKDIAADANLANDPAPRIQEVPHNLHSMYVLESFDFTWDNISNMKVNVEFGIDPKKYTARDFSDGTLQICQSPYMAINRFYLDCKPATITTRGAGFAASADFEPFAAMEFFLISSHPRGVETRFPWNESN